ncbi:reverse transcriptase domain-containing protein [Tanacetum coccineum]
MEDDVDINVLRMKQYIALIPDDIKPGIVNPQIGDDVEFEINANFMRELRRKLFVGTDNEDAYEHVHMVLEIVDLFHFLGVTHDAIMLRVFPITLKGRALRWKNRLPAGTITTWDLLKNEFIWRYCHPFITAKKLDEIRNFKQERDETCIMLGKDTMIFFTNEQMGSPYRTRKTVRIIGNPKEIHNAKAQEDERDMEIGWYITSKDVERLRQFLTPTIHTLPNLEPVVQPYIPLGPVYDMDKIVREEERDYDIPLIDSVMQPLPPQAVHITPPDDDYVVPATNHMSDKQLNKFEEEFYNITKVVEKEYDNPVIKTCDYETFIRKLLHQVSQSSKEMKSQQQYGSNLSFPYPVANHGVHCYSHSHLILSEGRNTLLLGKYGWSQARDSNKNKRFMGGTL